MLSLLKPDNVTGQVFANPKTVGAYIATQKEIIRDYDVAGQTAEDLGWLSDPRMIRQYQARPATDTRDFRRWLSQKVADRTTATLTAGQILEITFSSGNPIEAKVGGRLPAQGLSQCQPGFTTAGSGEERRLVGGAGRSRARRSGKRPSWCSRRPSAERHRDARQE